MAPEQTHTFKHGTAEVWIVGVASFLLVALASLFIRETTQAAKEQAARFDELKDRFIRVEAKVESVHLALVDIPNLKLEQARMDLRLQQLEARQRSDARDRQAD